MVDTDAVVPRLASFAVRGGKGGDLGVPALVALLSQPNGVVRLTAVGGSLGGG